MRGGGAARRRSSARGKKERHAPGFSSPGHSNSGRRLLRLCPCDARGAFPFHGSSGNGSSREREATRAPRQRRSWPLHALSSRAALAPPGCFGHEWLPGVAAAAPTIDAARLQRFHGCGWRRIRSKARHHRRMARGGQPALRAPRGVRGFLRRVHSPPGVASVLTAGGVRRTLESSLGISPGRGISISRRLHLEVLAPSHQASSVRSAGTPRSVRRVRCAACWGISSCAARSARIHPIGARAARSRASPPVRGTAPSLNGVRGTGRARGRVVGGTAVPVRLGIDPCSVIFQCSRSRGSPVGAGGCAGARRADKRASLAAPCNGCEPGKLRGHGRQ